jgi:Fe(3+) dicitrate transport protein
MNKMYFQKQMFSGALAVGMGLFILAQPSAGWADEKPKPAKAQDAVELQEISPAKPKAGAEVLGEVKVIGSKEKIREIAGSAAYLDEKEIQTHNYDDINRILKHVPGVYVREEDGFGLFPNISLRGVDPGRSSKTTLMEDGILTAPATYSAPEAYYSPTSNRMKAIEVLKGSSQIQFGPHTTGGVINYLSTEVPTSERFYSKMTLGSNYEVRNHTYFGNTFDTEFGKFGILVENFYRSNEGFKHFDPAPDLRETGNTGFRKEEPMTKLVWEPNSSKYQRFEAKFGYTDMTFNEGYLGLSEQDFRNDPFRRYNSTRFDKIDSEHWRSYLRHFITINPTFDLVTTAYGNVFERNWQKLDSCRVGGALTSNLSLGQCLQNTQGLAILKGEAAGTLRFRNNDRQYYTAGGESILNSKFQLGETDHKLQTGVRFHHDQAKRFQQDETLTQGATGAITSRVAGIQGGAGSRNEETNALAFHVKDAIKFQNFTFTPGARYEHLFVKWDEQAPSTPVSREGDYGIWAAGGSLNYNFMNTSVQSSDVFGGIHRGISVPGPQAHLKDKINEETSLGYELGYRYKNHPRAFGVETIFFLTDLSNLIVVDNLGASGGGLGVTENAGKVRSWGFEFQAQYDPGTDLHWAVKNPWYANFTYTNATFRETATSTNPESIFAAAQVGNKVPYVPDWQFNVGSGLIYGKFSAFADYRFVNSVFGTGNNSASQINPLTGGLDSRFGETDIIKVLDISANYQYNKTFKFFTNFYNLTNEQYIVTRLPEGPRPGAPFMMLAGVEAAFF